MIDLKIIDVMDLLERLDLKNMRYASGGSEVSYSCPGADHSHGDDRPSAFMNVESTAFHCHGCKMSGNAIHLVMVVQQVTSPMAERWLRENFGLAFTGPANGSLIDEIENVLTPKPSDPEPVRPPTSWLSSIKGDWEFSMEDDLQNYQFYALSRGFTPETMSEWDIGYDFVGDYLTVPAFQIDGEFWGAKGRSLDPMRQPKYMILGDRSSQRYGFDPYPAAEMVVGLHRKREHKTVVICEGELNAVALSQMGVERPVAIGMSYFSRRHAELIIREADEAILYFDYGEAGSKCVFGTTAANGHHRPGAIELLEPFIKVRVVLPPTADDPADLLQQQRSDEALRLIRDAPSSMALELQSV